MQRYDPKTIEPKWQKIWEETGTYTANLQSDKPKYIAMSMFNYPSGAGIHIGHAMNYTISDVKARFKRQQGFESYHPVGWDAFGLPAENYAIKAGVSPQESMATIIPSYHKQYKAMGWSNDWEKEISTHLPEYYKWTQWIFSEMFRQGLAYQDTRLQWWCTIDNSVLANEQVIDGKCWRHDGPDDPLVEKREVKQWFFKITDYADELLEAIDGLDWTESVKLAQKNWIGKSIGAEIDFALHRVCNPNPDMARTYIMGQKNITKNDIESLGGKVESVTDKGYLCVEFPITKTAEFEKIISEKMEPGFWNEYMTNEKVVFIFKYKDGKLERFELDDENAHKICVIGNQFNDDPEPRADETAWQWLENNSWYAPIVPKIRVFTTAHDTIYGVTFMVLAPEHELVEQLTTDGQRQAVGAYVKESEKKSDVERQAEKEKTGVFTGSYAINPINGKKIPIWIADYVLVGYGTGAIMAVPGEDQRDYEFAQKFNLEIIYTITQQEFVEYADIKATPVKFTLANSEEFNGQNFKEGRAKILDKLIALGVGQEKVNYKMRDWSVSRQRYWGAPIPIINCPKDGPVLVPDEDLPVVLPELVDFEPNGDGRSALARAKDWLVVDCPKCGGKAERETDTLDTYIDSSWYMYRYFDPHDQQAIFDNELVKKWEPIDFYNGGDHATAHLLYARFMARFFTKLGLVNEPEPFKQFLFNGKVTASDGSAFSKSKGNGIDPLEIISSGYGADALRTYLMFAAPLELGARWDPQGVPGTYRFLNRLWNLVQEYGESKVEGKKSKEASEASSADELLRSTNRMIKKVTEDIEVNHYNTAIAAMMGCVNELYKFKTAGFEDRDTWQQALEHTVACVAPFAPHVADELWLQLGHSTSVHKDSWPKFDEKYLSSETMIIVVQVNGKLRAQLEQPADATEEQIVTAAKTNEKVKSALAGKDIKKAIYVKQKLVNFVVG